MVLLALLSLLLRDPEHAAKQSGEDESLGYGAHPVSDLCVATEVEEGNDDQEDDNDTDEDDVVNETKMFQSLVKDLLSFNTTHNVGVTIEFPGDS